MGIGEKIWDWSPPPVNNWIYIKIILMNNMASCIENVIKNKIPWSLQPSLVKKVQGFHPCGAHVSHLTHLKILVVIKNMRRLILRLAQARRTPVLHQYRACEPLVARQCRSRSRQVPVYHTTFMSLNQESGLVMLWYRRWYIMIYGMKMFAKINLMEWYWRTLGVLLAQYWRCTDMILVS